MNDWSKGMIIGASIATVIGWVAAIVLASSIAASYRTQAIEHGAARYHPTTGEFEWIDRAEGESE